MARVSPLLYDWDLVHAVRIDLFEKLMGTRGEQQKARTVSLTSAETLSTPADLEWLFKPWRIAAAAGGEFSFELGFRKGALRFKDKTYDLTPLTCRIDVDMGLREKARKLEAAGLKPHRVTLSQPLTPESWAGAIVEDPRPSGNKYNEMVRALVKTALDKWFLTAEGSAAFDDQFADLTILTETDKGEAAWPMPSALGLAGAAQPDPKRDGNTMPTLGMLAMTGERNIGRASFMLSPYAIPDGEQAALLISSRCFLDRIIGPALTHAFAPEAARDDSPFTTAATGRMRNTSALQFPLATDDHRVHQPSAAAGSIECFVDGDELVLSIEDMTFPVTVVGFEAAAIHVSVHERFHLALRTVEGSGEKILTLLPAAAAQVTINEDKSLWAKLAPVVLESALVIVSSIAVARLGVAEKLIEKGFSAIAARVLAGLIVFGAGAAGNLLGRLPDLLSALEQDSLRKMPDFITVLAPALQSVQWPARVVHELTSVRFADCVQFGLTIERSPAA